MKEFYAEMKFAYEEMKPTNRFSALSILIFFLPTIQIEIKNGEQYYNFRQNVRNNNSVQNSELSYECFMNDYFCVLDVLKNYFIKIIG